MPTRPPNDPTAAIRVFDGLLLLAAARDVVRATAAPAFDLWRVAYALAASRRLVPRSMLASRDVESLIDATERCLLGPYARGV